MKFTFTDLKNLYYGCQILGWAEGDMSTIYDADVLFVADTTTSSLHSSSAFLMSGMFALDLLPTSPI